MKVRINWNATKRDLDAMEARIMAVLLANEADVLDRILARSRRLVRRAEALDSNTVGSPPERAQLAKDRMSQISEFAARLEQHQTRIDAALTGITADVEALKAEIVKLQNTPGVITPEDQALLDSIEARVAAVGAKVEALDALTPPVTP